MVWLPYLFFHFSFFLNSEISEFFSRVFFWKTRKNKKKTRKKSESEKSKKIPSFCSIIDFLAVFPLEGSSLHKFRAFQRVLQSIWWVFPAVCWKYDTSYWTQSVEQFPSRNWQLLAIHINCNVFNLGILSYQNSDRTVIRRLSLLSFQISGLSDVIFCQRKKEVHGRSVTKQSHDYLLVIEMLKRISEFLQIAENGKKLTDMQDDPWMVMILLVSHWALLGKHRYNTDK